MKTIEMKVGNKVVQFTSKSLIIDGTEYYYSKMSDIKHSASKHVYAFKYDGKTQYLQYDPKYESGLKVIFKKIHALGQKKAAAAAAVEKAAGAAGVTGVAGAAAEAVSGGKESISDAIAGIVSGAEEVAGEAAGEIEAVAESAVAGAEEVAGEAEAVAEGAFAGAEEVAGAVEGVVDEVAEDSDVAEAFEEAPAPEDETVFDFPVGGAVAEAPAEGEAAEAEAAGEVAADAEVEGKVVEAEGDTAEGKTPDEEKKGKLKKALLIFAGILIVIGILSAIYFSAFGTSSNPTSGPNSTESQQYDDIDELIEDLDN